MTRKPRQKLGPIQRLEAADDREPKLATVKNATRKVTPAHGGTPRVDILRAGLGLVRRMARAGHSNTSIAAALGMASTTFGSACRRQPEVAEALQVGRAGLEDELANILLEHARGTRGDNKTSVIAAIYLTKARCGWREGDQQEVKPNITIQLPAAQSPEAWAKAITVQHTAPNDERDE